MGNAIEVACAASVLGWCLLPLMSGDRVAGLTLAGCMLATVIMRAVGVDGVTCAVIATALVMEFAIRRAAESLADLIVMTVIVFGLLSVLAPGAAGMNEFYAAIGHTIRALSNTLLVVTVSSLLLRLGLQRVKRRSSAVESNATQD